MLLEVSNKTYQQAKKDGYEGSFAQFADMCNRKNSEMMNKTDIEKYFNDTGSDKTQSYTLLSDYTARIKSNVAGQLVSSEAVFKKGQVITGSSFDGGKTISTLKDGKAPIVNIFGGTFLYQIPMNLLKASTGVAKPAKEADGGKSVKTTALKSISFGQVFVAVSILLTLSIIAWYYYKKYKASGSGKG